MTGKEAPGSLRRFGFRGLHWTVAVAFFLLLLTGLIIYTPAFSGLASGGWTRLIHRIAAAVLVGAPVVYAVVNPRAARRWLADIGIAKSGSSTTPQVLNRWKRRHKLLISLGFVLVVVTGGLQWFFKGFVPSSVFNLSVFIHDILFFAAVLVLLYHSYFELYWWVWRRRYCRTCEAVACAGTCPVGAIVASAAGVVRDPVKCNNCRLCMEHCRRNMLYKEGGEAAARASVRPGGDARS